MQNDHIEELRLALVMNGGVSLAVWMGGVTNEIYRLVTLRHPVYAGLLDMTRTQPRVDVISGTSAGGINGAALGLALVYRTNFAMLRDVWMTMGSFDALLRHPMGDNPGSLLRGDEYFLPQIRDAFTKLAPVGAQPGANNCANGEAGVTPLDLRLTTTLLRGRPAFTVDDLGTPVGDIDHRARFRFQRTGPDDDFSNSEQLVARLSLAARSTASFPFAFEPSTVPAAAGNTRAAPLVDVNDVPLTLPRYVIDGGVLDNKPFSGAIESIFAMKAERGVRRVLAYINPDPGYLPTTDHPFDAKGTGAAGQPAADSIPGLAPVVAASLFGIPQAQTIADQLDEIGAHNHEVRMRRDSVLDLARLSACRNLRLLADDLFPLYRRRRIASTFEMFIYSYLPVAAAKHPQWQGAIKIQGKQSREALRLSFEAHEWQKWIPRECTLGPHDAQIDQSTEWEWGLLPVDFAAKTLLNVVRITQRLLDSLALRYAATDDRAPSQRAARLSDPLDWADPDEDPAQASAQRIDASPDGSEDLTRIWKQSFDIVDDIAVKNDKEEAEWTKIASALLKLFQPPSGPNSAIDMAGMLPKVNWEHLFAYVQGGNRRKECADLAYRIAEVFLLLQPIAMEVAESAVKSKTLNASDLKQAEGLHCLVTFLFKQALPVETNDPRRVVVSRLLQLEVIEYAFNERDLLAEDALIELVQISGNSKSPIGPETKAKAKEKLLGLALAHFAAFYKQSWRANDWLYGRLDGSERLVKVLLNPDRLQRVFRNSAAAITRIQEIAVDSVPSQRLWTVLQKEWNGGYGAAVAKELAFLDLPGSAPPDELPNCAAAITLRLHYGILREELPNLLNAIVDDQAAGADAAGPGEACRTTLAPCVNCAHRLAPCGACTCNFTSNGGFSPEQAKDVLESGLIGAERLADEAGSDLFTRTFAHTLATLQGTLASKRAKLGPISALFASLRVPVLGFYFVARGLTHQSRTSAALNGGILAVGAAIVAMQFLWTAQQLGTLTPPSVAHSIVTAGWALFAYGMLMSILRAPGTLCFLSAVATVGAAVAGFVFAQPALLAPFMFLVLVFLSVRYLWLQFTIGLFAIVCAGLWGSGKLGCVVSKVMSWIPLFGNRTPTPFDTQWAPAELSGVVVIAILLATWQMNPRSKQVEAWMKRKCGLK